MNNKLSFLLEAKANGKYIGVPSFCTANRMAIKACMQYAKKNSQLVIFEATANQVNQDGGYTGMKPHQYIDFIEKIADEVGFDKSQIVFGGDHLGPLTWSHLNEEEAMKNAEILVSQYIRSGFTKIHLDTSMKLACDPKDEPLAEETVASRGARLMKVCMDSFAEYQAEHPDADHPVYIIGSEVPIPGGAESNEEELNVTDPKAMEKTYMVYQEVFNKNGLSDALDYIIGIVVQPGVEFSDGDVHVYSSEKATDLSKKIKEIPNLVLEGHSTDYQPRVALKKMVQDGVAILKVGPALTFAVRAGLFALVSIEEKVVVESKRSNLVSVIDQKMDENNKNWIKHYHGTAEEIKLKRHYSYSDRLRYYLSDPHIENAIDELLKNIDQYKDSIPFGLLHQYMPEQYFKVRDGLLNYDAESLVLDWVHTFIEDYYLACQA
ncbi:MAG: class II D-tagatose-bisphosphate aldolase, non-catalytic subunit [Clostridiaceae bacterium]|nr:class II D-tagatose-bisphosphate aldolase, non-catalytic subunit [Clostridiaceae bacterium]